MRVIVSAGGTGGHIYPAISIINKIKSEDKNAEILYIGTLDRMESKIIPSLNIPYEGISMKGLKKDFTIFKSLSLFIKAIKKAKIIIKNFNPDIVIGVGGYITAPVIYSAKKMGYKTIIHEQNSIPGKSNRFLMRYTDACMVSSKESMKYFKNENVFLTGNPRSEEVLKAKSVSKKDYGFSYDKKLVLIVMGSLGSMTISNELLKIIPKFNNKKYEVLLVTGKDYFDKFKEIEIPNNVKIVPYLDNMLSILHIVDLIVSRSGASALSEITALGIPSILVPSPYVANNHQYYNALEISNAKGSIMIEEKDLNSDNLLKNIDLILNNGVLYRNMHENVLKFGITDSSSRIYKIIKNIIK